LVNSWPIFHVGKDLKLGRNKWLNLVNLDRNIKG
jgi:hypothetical protein